MGKSNEALFNYQKAVDIDNYNFDAYIKYGKLLIELERFDEAIQILNKVLLLDRTKWELNYLLSLSYYKAGYIDKAISHYREVLKLDSSNLLVLTDLSLILINQNEISEAIKVIEQLLNNYPNNYQGLFNLAYCYELLEQYDKSIEIYHKCTLHKNQSWEAYFNLANLYSKLEKFEEAEENYKTILNLNPQNYSTYVNLGNLYFRQFKLDDAIQILKKGVENTNHPDSYTNLGILLLEQFKFEESLEMHLIAENLNPKDPFVHINKSNTLFWMNRFSQAWKEYEWRFVDEMGKKIKNFFPIWQGEELFGKTILVRSEQGIGDIVQYVRYIKKIKEKGGIIIFECRDNLLSLFCDLDFIDKMITSEQIKDINADYEVFLLNIPGILNLSIFENNIKFPYINVNDKIFNEISQILPTEKIRIGLVWKGNPKHFYDFKRSTKLDYFLKLFDKKSFFVCNLQYPLTNEEELLLKTNDIINFEKYINNLEGTIALIKNLDLIITVDTAIAHIAGALDKTVWLLLSSLPDWRWGKTSDRSLLYPEIRIFKQTILGDWSSIFYDLKEALGRLNEYQKLENIYSKLKRAESSEKENNFAIAIEIYKEIIEEDPSNEVALLKLALVFHNQNNLNQAKILYLKLLEHYPENADALSNLALILREEFDFIQASKLINKAVKLQPTNVVYLNNLALIEENIKDSKFIENIYQKFLKNKLYNIETLINYSSFLLSNSRYEEALKITNLALKINPLNVDVHLNKSIILLHLGDYEKGFEEYEWRRKKKEFPTISYSGKELNTKNILDKRILIFDEQGFGDSFLFLRYISLLKKEGCYLIFQTRKELIKLYKQSLNVEQIISIEDGLVNINQFDYFIPLGSLPYYFSTNLENMPNNYPYIKIKKNNQSNSNLICENKPNIGFFWKGRTPLNNYQRTISLRDFEKIFDLVDIYNFVCLQKDGINNEENLILEKYKIKNNSCSLTDFNETSKIIEDLDFVIGIDSAVMNLTGAMGKKGILLLSTKSDWRWKLINEKSIWYPTIKIFKQKKFQNWDDPIDEVINYLINSSKYL